MNAILFCRYYSCLLVLDFSLSVIRNRCSYRGRESGILMAFLLLRLGAPSSVGTTKCSYLFLNKWGLAGKGFVFLGFFSY